MSGKLKHPALAAAALAAIACRAHAALTFTVEAGGWPNDAHRTAAVNAIQATVNRYNAYGDFGNYNVYVYYNAGIPTAQASYLGSIGFGGTYPNERVTMHEMAHYLGSGTYGDPWDGFRSETLIDQFEGMEASLSGDSAHFWPYGLNYDSEGAEINKQRQVAMVYAQRADMGIGSTANPWSATVVTQTASDPVGESSFNYAARWSDGRFAHPGAGYSTGPANLLRTPTGTNSFTFVGDSLTINNTNGISGGLLYKGSGASGVTTFKNLIVNGGYVRHASGAGDLFNLAGKVTLGGSPTFDAAQGEIRITAAMSGTGSFTKIGGFPTTLTGANSYTGSTNINAGTLRLAPAVPVATYSFDSVSGSSVVNGGTGGSAMNGTLANGAVIVGGGRFGNAVSLASGASVDINNPILDLRTGGNWTVSAWVKTTTAGGSILTKGDGGWSYGNTIFYLGDGSAGGSGGVPSSVRWAGGFFQGSASATSVLNNAWHMVTYVNVAGNYSIYLDGVLQSLSAGNGSFSALDIGSLVRLGVSTNTVAADGTVNYNGLLDDVRFYGEALSQTQIAALFQGANYSILPTTTDVSIASGATLDVNGTTQQIATLNGPAGAAVTLGAGQLILNSSVNSSFAGTISGVGGSLVKDGSGTLTLSGNNIYTGGTNVAGGTLIAERLSNGQLTIGAGALARITPKGAPNSASGTTVIPALSIAAGGQLDLTNNSLVIDYVGSVGSLVDDTRMQLLDGRLTSSAADATHKLGYADNAVLGKTSFGGVAVDASSILVKYTFTGDANLDGQVDITDLAALATAWQTAGPWTSGDFDYSGFIDITDLAALATNWQAGVGAPLAMTFEQALASVGLGGVAVPEPVSLLGLSTLALLGQRIGKDRHRTDYA